MANIEHFKLILKGVQSWSYSEFHNYLTEPNLQGADLIEVDFTELDLSGANLSGANLSGAILYKANFREALFYKANLSKANLSKANLSEAYLFDANLSEANLSEVDLSRAFLKQANLLEADLSRANLLEAELSSAIIKRANLSEANFSEAILTQANLSRANFSGANFSGADLSRAIIKSANLSEANFSGANLRGTILSNAFCQNTNFTNVSLHFARLSNINLDGANLTGVHLWETQRAGWSIKDVTCEYAYFEDNDTPTYFSPGEFEKLYSNKTKIVLSFQDGISPLEFATLPALIQHLESFYPGCHLRLESITDAAGGASVILVVDNDGNFKPEEIKQIKTQLEEKGKEIIHFQKLALQEEKTRLKLEGKMEALRDVVKEFIMRPTNQLGDIYNQRQGIQGREVHDIHHINFNQIGRQIEKLMNLSELAGELSKLWEAMSQEAKESAHRITLGNIAEAEAAAREGNSSKVAERLKTAGNWSLDFATKVGASLAAKAIEIAMGM